jgi:PAS domain S-box-containing protein
MSIRELIARTPEDRKLVALAVVLALGIFVVDLKLPADVDITGLYGIVVILGLSSRQAVYPLAAASGVTVLTVAGGLASLPILGHELWTRVLTVVGIWVTAWLVSGYTRVGVKLQRSLKDLADTNFALDQSAIVAVTDVSGRIKYVNDKFCEISKYTREELIGRDHRIINSGYHPKEFIRDLWQTIAHGRIWRGEIRNRAKDGTIYWVDTTIVPFLDDRGKPYQYMAIRYDITERKRGEALLREQAALARLGEMAAVVAHEVKNPLAGIRGALQVIGTRMPETSRERAIMGEIIARVDSLNEIVQDLLVFARPREPKLGPVSVAQLLENTAGLLKKDAAHSSVDVSIAGDRPLIEADPEQLQTVFLNLLLNAAQASSSGGRIDVTISATDGLCRVDIADRGPGIAPDVLAKIFEPFFTTKHRGTGLGLPTARRVVERHGGRIDVSSPSGGGTIVTVTLPVDPKRAPDVGNPA